MLQLTNLQVILAKAILNCTESEYAINSTGINVGSSRKKPMIISPLATHESRAAPSPSFTSPSAVTPKFFEQGVGTQVMLASMSSQAKELLIDHARRKMQEADVSKLKECLEKVPIAIYSFKLEINSHFSNIYRTGLLVTLLTMIN